MNCCHPTSDVASRQWLRSSSRHHLVVPTSSQHARSSDVLRRRSDGLERAAWRPQRPVAQCRQFQEGAKDASVSECTWTLSALEALRNVLYKFKTYLLTYLLTYRIKAPKYQLDHSQNTANFHWHLLIIVCSHATLLELVTSRQKRMQSSVQTVFKQLSNKSVIALSCSAQNDGQSRFIFGRL